MLIARFLIKLGQSAGALWAVLGWIFVVGFGYFIGAFVLLTFIGILGFVLAHTIGDPNALRAALERFAVLIFLTFGVYLMFRGVGGFFRRPR